MKKFSVFKNISLLIALVAVVYLIANYSGSLRSEIFKTFNIPGSSVQGASTKRAEEISGKIQSDLNQQLGVVQEQLLNLTLADVINGASRLQKIPKDFNSLKDFTQKQMDDMLKSKK